MSAYLLAATGSENFHFYKGQITSTHDRVIDLLSIQVKPVHRKRF